MTRRYTECKDSDSGRKIGDSAEEIDMTPGSK